MAETGWFTRDQMAGIFGVLANSFDAGVRKMLPDHGAHIRKEKQRVLFKASAYVQAWLAAELEKRPGGEDQMMTGGPFSPALEKYREERAILVRLDRLAKEKTVLPRDVMHEGLARGASILRGAGETLARQFGNDAGAILTDALEDWGREIESLFPPVLENGEEGTGPAEGTKAVSHEGTKGEAKKAKKKARK